MWKKLNGLEGKARALWKVAELSMYVSQGVDVRRENKLETYERKEIINETKFGQIQENGIKCVSRGINLGMGYKFICLLIE